MIAVGFGVLTLGLILGAAVRAVVLSTVYRGVDSETLAINDAAGQFLVAAIFMSRPGTVDAVLYGRYNDYILPVMMGIGLMFIYGHRTQLKHILFVILIHTAILPITLYAVKKAGSNLVRGYFMAGISYMTDDTNFDAFSELAMLYVLSILSILIVCFGIWISRKFRIIVPVVSLLMFAEILLGMRLNYKYTYAFNDITYAELEVSYYIGRSNESVPITYIYGGDNTYIEAVQFHFPARRIDVITEGEYISYVTEAGEEYAGAYKRNPDVPAEYLIVDIDSEFRPQIEQYYMPCVESGNFALYYLDDGNLWKISIC